MKKVLKFTTKNCGACVMLSSVISQVEDLPEIVEIDCEDSPEIAGEYEVYQVPTLVLMENDKEIKRHLGFMSKQQLQGWVK